MPAWGARGTAADPAHPIFAEDGDNALNERLGSQRDAARPRSHFIYEDVDRNSGTTSASGSPSADVNSYPSLDATGLERYHSVEWKSHAAAAVVDRSFVRPVGVGVVFSFRRRMISGPSPSIGEGLFLCLGVGITNLNSRLRLLAWQIDLLADERSEGLEKRDDTRGHVAKWEGGGPQNRYERVRFSPWPKIIQRVGALVNLGRRQTPKL